MSSPKQNSIWPTAFTIPLQGIHLIEASAGTGKTWTLSALVVRLLVAGIAPKQMIATTFTRAASAEMRMRIFDRINEVHSILSIEDTVLAMQAAIDSGDLLSQFFLTQFQQQSSVLKNIDGSEYSNQWDSPQRIAAKRLKTAKENFDELFVSTLDSFCQKLLREFAFDTGQSETLNISENEPELREQIVHDALRQWRSQQSSALIDLLVATGKLTDVSAHTGMVGTVLNFLSATLAEPNIPHIDFAKIDLLFSQLAQINTASFNAFFTPEGEFFASLNGKKSFKKHGSALVSLCAIKNALRLVSLDKNALEIKLLEGFIDVDSCFNSKKPKDLDALAQFKQLPDVAILEQLAYTYQLLIEQINQTSVALQFYLANAVREQLPVLLASRNETSFAQQMRLLADVLTSPEGNTLAQQILQRYPVLLVDEFQDTNQDQDRVIASIYRNPAQKMSQQCLMLVGDPKQAIYGFRGGDVQTYLAAKQEVNVENIHELPINQRTIKPLVDAVDCLFGLNTDFGEAITYSHVDAAATAKAALIEKHPAGDLIDPYPLKIMVADNADDALLQTAWQITHLLQAAQTWHLLYGERIIQPEDIAVLCHNGRDLDHIQKHLQAWDVPVWRPSKVSVFASPIALDLQVLMQLWLKPFDDKLLRRLCAGVLMGWTLQQLDELPQEQQMRLQLQFAEQADVWVKKGFLAAWQLFANTHQIWQTVARHTSAVRHLVNLRHLLELVHIASEKTAGVHYLLVWLSHKITALRDVDTDMERRLPGQNGVQLMTIHGSKGLEFPIVFAPTLDVAKTYKDEILFYQEHRETGLVRVLGFKSKLSKDADQQAKKIEQHHARTLAENCRLAYVALTRAKNRLYVCFINKSNKVATNQHPPVLRHWLETDAKQLLDKGAQVDLLDTVKEPHMPLANPMHHHIGLIGKTITHKPMIAWGATSFTALMRDVDMAQLEAAIHSVAYEQGDDALEVMPDDVSGTYDIETSKALSVASRICFDFPRGANSGNCLHKILEYLDPTRPDKWLDTFRRQLQNHGINQVAPDLLQAWFLDILHAALPEQASLATLGFKNRLRELEFQLSLKNDHIAQQQLLARLAESDIHLPYLNRSHAVRYLKGAIDLIYEHKGKYYVADYKSNYLGATIEGYSEAAIKQNMHEAGYFLQASIYLVALHRYLRVRLPNYSPQQHLGGACYLYLRGMQANKTTGLYFWQADVHLILDLDRILGQYT